MLTPQERQAREMQGRAIGCGCAVLAWTFLAVFLAVMRSSGGCGHERPSRSEVDVLLDLDLVLDYLADNGIRATYGRSERLSASTINT